MNIDWPHMLLTILLIVAVAGGLERSELYRNASRGKRFGLMALCIFVVLTVLNLLWPYGA